MPPLVATSYDEVPYESYPYPLTHPDRIATIATLFGLAPAPVTKCRVLELGCSAGGNLIPMALGLPGSEFVGVDLSRTALEQARSAMAPLALTNLRLRQMSFADVGEEFGTFDYIIVHGVFSWVSRELQERLLAVCHERLAPHGVALISYNTYPGWHMQGMMREMMSYHARKFADPAQRITQARALLNFLAASAQNQEGPYGQILRQQLQNIRQRDDFYFFHEYLEEFNEPIYFHQFVERAATHGLQYLGESLVHTMAGHSFPAEVKATLQSLSASVVEAEQYLDFLRNTPFRQTLLCPSERTVSYRVSPELVTRFYMASDAAAVDDKSDLSPEVPASFRSAESEVAITTRDPLLKAALLSLAKHWPTSLPFDDVFAEASALLGGGPHDPAMLKRRLLRCYMTSRVVEFRTHKVPLASQAGAFPKTTALVRLQAATQKWVTSLRHMRVTTDEGDGELLRALDGTQEVTALKERFPDVEERLRRFARSALLVA